MDKNWTRGLGGVVPDMMPPCLLAALRDTSSSAKSLVFMIFILCDAPDLVPIGFKFNRTHFWRDSRGMFMFHVWIFSAN